MPDSRLVVNCSTNTATSVPLTPAEQAAFDAANATNTAAKTQEQQDAATLRAFVVNRLQPLVGLNVTALTAAQVRDIMIGLLYKARVIDKTGVVQPLQEWL